MSEKLKKSQIISGLGIIKIFYLIIILNLSSALDVLIVQNDNKKDNQIWSEEIKKQFKAVIDFQQCNYSTILECFNMYPAILAVLDISNDFETQLSLSQLCKEYKKIHFVIQQNYEYSYNDEWTYSIFPSNLAQIEAYFDALKYFNWTQGVVISDEDNAFIKQNFLDYSDNFDYYTIESSSNIENFVRRVIKPLGATLYYIFANSLLSVEIQKELKSKKLLLNGDGIILNQNSGYDCVVDGAIIITVAGQEYAISQENSLFTMTQNFLQYLVNSTSETTTVEEIKYLLKKYSEKNQFSIVNIRSSNREIVGSISDGIVTIFGELNFPGNAVGVPKSAKKILNLTASAGSYSPGGLPVTSTPLFFYGASTAWSLINDGTFGILKNFHINHFVFDCGARNWDVKYATACFTKNIDKFGLAHIPQTTSYLVSSEISLFKSLNLTIPMVGSVSRADFLSSKALYPLFTRVSISDAYQMALSMLLFRGLGWKKASVLYENTSTGILQYSTLLKSAEQYSLEILNPESSRALTLDSNRTIAQSNTYNSLKDVIDTQTRLVFLLIQPPQAFYVLEQFYDLGLRKGDLFTYVLYSPFLTWTSYDFKYSYKLKETGAPMITIDTKSWVGKFGQNAYSQIAALYKTNPLLYACAYFDAGYLIALALDYMISQGFDFYDPNQTTSAIRAQKFAGCTGTVSIDKDSNDRIIETFDINGNIIDETSGNATAFKIGEFHPYSSKLLTIQSPIVYGDGTTIKPDDLRNQNNECPFPDKLIRTFNKGRFIIFGLCFGFALISLTLTIFIWKRWWNINIEELKERHEISLEDLIVELTICIEFFQFAAMGPDITPISSFLGKISNSLSFNLENILKLKNGVFWMLLDGVYGAIILWLTLCLIILLRLDEHYPRFSIFRFLAWLAGYLMPILGNLCFIPIVSMCLNVFVCDHSIGDNFTDSFLADDCYYFCWKDEHLIYAIFSFIALLCYEPLAVFCRPLWQELHNNVHIHASPLFLMIKTVFQIVFISMNKTVKRAESTVHGVLFAILMAAYIVFIFRFKPYNYPRLSWWQGLSLIGVLWLSVLSTISSNIEADYLIYFLLLCAGWMIIAIIGIYVQKKKYPSLLYRKKGLDTTFLYKFAFAFGKHSKIALSKIAPNRSSEVSMPKEFSLVKPN